MNHDIRHLYLTVAGVRKTREEEDSVGKIRARSEVQKASMMVKVGELRSEKSTRDVALDQLVDDGDGVVELNACDDGIVTEEQVGVKNSDLRPSFRISNLRLVVIKVSERSNVVVQGRS
ncbi:hypothetical protein ACFX13_024877 [Malus domestica]